MKPRNAKIIDRVNYRDKHGTSRWIKLRECSPCHKMVHKYYREVNNQKS